MTEVLRRTIDTFLRRFVFFKSSNRTVQELLFYYALAITFAVTLISLVSNTLLGLPLSINIFTLGGMFLSIFFFWLSYKKRRTVLAQNLFLIYLGLSLNALWLLTDGSAGSTLFLLQGFLMVVVLYETTKTIKVMVIVLFVNVLALFALEIAAPELIAKYASNQQRTLDILVVTILFFIILLPVLLFAKKTILQERNNAIQSEALKTSFFLSLSHEIRTPMNAILGFSELLEDDDLPTEQRHQFLGIINQNGRALLNLLNNVISFSKLESNKDDVALSQINTEELVQQVFYSLQQVIDQQKPIDFRMSCPTQPVTIQTDALKLYQILLNITYNAIKFTDKGFVEIGYSADDTCVTFRIIDSGCGIPEHMQIDIFERFIQAGQTLKSSTHHGAGLGLAICKRLSVLINAQICFESTEGKGTTFQICVPIKATATPLR